MLHYNFTLDARIVLPYFSPNIDRLCLKFGYQQLERLGMTLRIKPHIFEPRKENSVLSKQHYPGTTG